MQGRYPLSPNKEEQVVKAKTKSRRKGNPDALARHREAKKQAEAEQQEVALAGAVKTGDIELSGDLAVVFTALKQAQEATDTAKALEGVQEAFGRLDPAALAKIVSTPIVQDIIGKLAVAAGGENKPGSYIFDKEGRPIGKIPWTGQDILDQFPMVTWTPSETLPITYQSHTINVIANEEVTAPSCFKMVWDHHLKAVREQGALNLKGLEDHFGPMVAVESGWKGKEGA
jgi:hypothetical protein